MLIAQNLVSVFHFVLKVHNFLTTILYKTAKKEKGRALGYISLSCHITERYNLQYKVAVAYASALFLQIVHAVKFDNSNNGEVSLVALVPSLLFLFSLSLHLPTLREHIRKRNDFCPLFNAFLDFERKHNGTLSQSSFYHFLNNFYKFVDIHFYSCWLETKRIV